MLQQIEFKEVKIKNKAFAASGNAQGELNGLFEAISQLKMKDRKIRDDLSTKIYTRFTKDNIDEVKGQEKNLFFLLGDTQHKLYYVNAEGNSTEITFNEYNKQSFNTFFQNYQHNGNYEINSEYYAHNLDPLLMKSEQKDLFPKDLLTSSIPKPVITAFEQFYMQIGTDFNQDPKARRHYKGNAKIIHAMNDLAKYILNTQKPENDDPKHDYYVQLRALFLAVDEAAKHYQSNNKRMVWVAAATVLGAIVGAIVGFGVAALVTFLTGGLALPVAALIGIGVGAAVAGATTGALVGGLGMYHGKAKHYKGDVAPGVETAIGKEKQDEVESNGLAKALEDAGYLKKPN